jgi:hypothetical protein
MMKVSLALCQFHQHFTCGFFCMKILRAAFLYLQFRFVLFWRKKIGTTRKMLVKLTTMVKILIVSKYNQQDMKVRNTNTLFGFL